VKNLFAFIVFLFLGIQASAAQPSTKAIVGGTVVNPDGTAPIVDAVIVIVDSRIEGVGPRDSMRIPEGAEVIDAAGKWIIPGLVDAHIHFFQSGGLYTRPDIIDLRKRVPYAEGELVWIRENLDDTFARYVACGVTSVVDVGGPMWNFNVREMAKGTIAPRVAVAGPLISTYQPEALTTDDPPIIKVKTPDEARELVRRQAEKQADLIKIWYIVRSGQDPRENLPIVTATIEESQKHGIRVAVHATELEAARLVVEAGAAVLVHSVQDAEVDAEFVELLKKREVIYIPTLVVLEGYRETIGQEVRLIPEEYEMANPYVVSTLFDLREVSPEDISERLRERIASREQMNTHGIMLRNIKILQDAGITIAAGTDAGNIGTFHGPSIFREFELMAEAGLSPMEILTDATLHGAMVMGRENELGSIEEGKLADMVHAVFVDGEMYYPGELVTKTPSDLVQQPVNAYNARDLDAFLATYSDDIEIYDHPDNLLWSGKDAITPVYRSRFESSPGLHAEIVRRTALGNFVVDHERVTGLPDGRTVEAVAIYEVQDGAIRRVWFIREF
jgi:imidazolonepropionase-like amidohydrolase